MLIVRADCITRRVRNPIVPLSLSFVLLSIISVSACGGGSTMITPPPPPPPASFALTITPQSTSMAPGQTMAVQVGATPMNGFNSTITVNLTGLPSGVTSTPSSPFTMTTAGQSLTLAASPSAAQGLATLSFEGTSGTLSSPATLSLDIAPFANFVINTISGPIIARQGGSTSQLFATSSGAGQRTICCNSPWQGFRMA